VLPRLTGVLGRWIVSEWHKNGHAFNYVRLNPDVDLKKLVSIHACPARSTKRAMSQILGIAHGVRVLHNMSPPVIHGDITGQHVLIDIRGRPLLSEFTFTRVSTSMYTRTTSTPALTAH
jgi:hypothetical protein